MATNVTREIGNQLAVTVSHPTAPVSGDPCRWGEKVGVALADEDTVTGKTTVKFDGCATFSVKGVDGSGNSAVAVGDILYYVDADTPKLSKKATGVRFGYAAGTVGSGSTATITVEVGY